MSMAIPNNLPELPEDITIEGFKKLIEELIKDLDLKDSINFAKHMISESETPEELDICEHTVEAIRKKFINRIINA
jgi:hypothetical protein